jgi:hypothetical protein
MLRATTMEIAGVAPKGDLSRSLLGNMNDEANAEDEFKPQTTYNVDW